MSEQQFDITDWDEIMHCPICSEDLMVRRVGTEIQKTCFMDSEHGAFFVKYVDGHPLVVWTPFAEVKVD